MYPKADVIIAVGKYGGPIGILMLILTSTIYLLTKIPGSPEEKNKRFVILARMALIFGIISLCLTGFSRLPDIALKFNKTINKTTGDASAVITDNKGDLSIQSNPCEKAKEK